MTPTTIALTVLVLVLLGDSALAISLGARTAETRREIARIQSRLDSLSRHQEDLSRRLLVRDALATASNGRIPASQISRLASEIDRNSRLYNFDPLLILAVVLTESQGDFNATGKFTSGAASGAVGVMQVKPSTARATALRMGIELPDREDLLDPGVNLAVGVAYLLQMVHRYGDLRLGIMAYNVGETALESALRGEIELPEAYYRKVYTRYEILLRHSREAVEDQSSAGTHPAVRFAHRPCKAGRSTGKPAYV
ncbi:MAG TPA: transglycosylase SLT domain-containing protein [Fibrobacteria bacterium]|nr:transglycosylase SLT domain-containing protein [Fibrobacteria bacterium]